MTLNEARDVVRREDVSPGELREAVLVLAASWDHGDQMVGQHLRRTMQPEMHPWVQEDVMPGEWGRIAEEAADRFCALAGYAILLCVTLLVAKWVLL